MSGRVDSAILWTGIEFLMGSDRTGLARRACQALTMGRLDGAAGGQTSAVVIITSAASRMGR